MAISIIKAILIIVIMAMMALLLLGINHIFSGSFKADKDDADRLRSDVETKDDVITDDNIFHDLVKSPADGFKPGFAHPESNEKHKIAHQ